MLIGGGGHCKSVISSINRDEYSDIIIVDISESIGKLVCEIPIVGTDNDLPLLFMKGYAEAFITLGSVSSNHKRIESYDKLNKIGFKFPYVIDKSSLLSDDVTVGEGVFIGKNVIINSCSSIGNFSIINTGTIVDHDCKIGNFVHLSPGVVLSGGVSIGDNTHVGTASCIKHGISIGSNVTIGMGSVVLHDIPNDCTAFGNPCRIYDNIS